MGTSRGCHSLCSSKLKAIQCDPSVKADKNFTTFGKGSNKKASHTQNGLGVTGYRYYRVNKTIMMLIHQQSQQERTILLPKFLWWLKHPIGWQEDSAIWVLPDICSLCLVLRKPGAPVCTLSWSRNEEPFTLQPLYHSFFLFSLSFPLYPQICTCLSQIRNSGAT